MPTEAEKSNRRRSERVARFGGYNVGYAGNQIALQTIIWIILVVFSFAIGSIMFDSVIPASGTGFANVCKTTDVFYYGYRILGVSASTCGTRDVGLTQIAAMLIPLGMLTKIVKITRAGQ